MQKRERVPRCSLFNVSPFESCLEEHGDVLVLCSCFNRLVYLTYRIILSDHLLLSYSSVIIISSIVFVRLMFSYYRPLVCVPLYLVQEICVCFEEKEGNKIADLKLVAWVRFKET